MFSKRSMRRNSYRLTKRRASIMSTDLSMIWLLKSSKEMVESYGHARTTMVMYKVILSPRAMAHLVS